MRIIIDYESSWRNSVLTGSNDKPVSKENIRKFKASSKSSEPLDIRKITDNTVLGVLCRLIGDQRKLYQAKQSDDFYFKDMIICHKEIESKYTEWNETTFLVNKSENRPPQSSFLGVIPDDEPLFFSENSATLWSVLNFSFEELLSFIINPKVSKVTTTVSPRNILNRVVHDLSTMDKIEFFQNKIQKEQEGLDKELLKEKPSSKRVESYKAKIENLVIESNKPDLAHHEKRIREAIECLQARFEDQDYYDKKGNTYPMSLYAGGLYVMLEEMKKYGMDITSLASDKGTIKGFSKRNYNGTRDFLNTLAGGKKKTTHTPYTLTKANGRIEIELKIDKEQAKDLKNKIESAGVSSFYLGKKGLAYVFDIKLR
ncbi:type I-Fv CRISPR-associated protein Cas5fv [Psychrobacter sp. HD31]|uniref:type I-Fv CRISPR-associated protein Cas5fv n=1 Tax=Psychrobacter sp. HD31 TaxID=3112003 RepID=UPI003DA4B9C5